MRHFLALLFLCIGFSPIYAQTSVEPDNETPTIVEPLINARLKPARVRMGVSIASFKRVEVRRPKGDLATEYIKLEPLRATLRMRLEQINHFHFGQWHVESIPLSWRSETQDYRVQLNFYEKFGVAGDLEEKIGSLEVAGKAFGAQRLYNFVGQASQKFVNKMNEPKIQVEAGTPLGLDESAISKANTNPERGGK